MNDPNPINNLDPGAPQNAAYDYSYRMTLPQSELQFNMLTTNGVWGTSEVSEEISESLRDSVLLTDENGNLLQDMDGQPIRMERRRWDKFSMYNRDLRLGNLDSQELFIARYNLDTSFMLLQMNMKDAFSVSLGSVATITETSQSKAGFLRRRMNTLTNEHVSQELDPPKKRLFSNGRSE